jgi:hypothetical protein
LTITLSIQTVPFFAIPTPIPAPSLASMSNDELEIAIRGKMTVAFKKRDPAPIPHPETRENTPSTCSSVIS